MKFRTFITPLAAVSGLVLVVGLSLLTWLLLRNPLSLIDQGGLKTPAALQFVPKQATLVGSLLARPDRLTDVWEYLAAPEVRQQTRQDIEQIEHTLLAGTGLDYQQDILPWLGEELTAAVISSDIDQNPNNGEDPGYLVALACEDSDAARATLEIFWQNRAIAGDALTFEDFAGNRLIYSTRPVDSIANTADASPAKETGRLATTLVANQFVLVANHPDVLRQALTAAQAIDNNLASDPRYRSAIQALTNTRIGLLAVNLPAITQANEPAVSGPTLAPRPITGLGARVDNPDWGLVSLGLTRAGLLGDFALLSAPGQAFEPHRAEFTEIPEPAYYLPSQAAITAIGHNVKALWSLVTPLLQQGGLEQAASIWAEPDLSTILSGNLKQTLLDGLSRDFALALTPGQTSDWLFASPPSDAMSEALNQLHESAQRVGVGINTLTIDGVPTTALAKLRFQSDGQSHGKVLAQVLGLHAQVRDIHIMASSPDRMEEVLVKAEQNRALPAWTEDLGYFRTPNQGYIHIRWPQLQSGLSQKLRQLRLWETAAEPVLKHLQAITLTSYDRTRELQTGRVYVQLSNQ